MTNNPYADGKYDLFILIVVVLLCIAVLVAGALWLSPSKELCIKGYTFVLVDKHNGTYAQLVDQNGKGVVCGAPDLEIKQ